MNVDTNMIFIDVESELSGIDIQDDSWTVPFNFITKAENDAIGESMKNGAPIRVSVLQVGQQERKAMTNATMSAQALVFIPVGEIERPDPPRGRKEDILKECGLAVT